MLRTENTVFVHVDVQGKLATIMHEKEELVANLQRLIRGTRALSVPVIWMEQIPEKMGETRPELRELLQPAEPIRKSSFSCCGEPAFRARLESLGRKQVLLAGIETHVCVYQTAADLVRAGYEVEVAADAVSSRTLSNKQIGLRKMESCGVRVTSTEMALFELMRTADHAAFREILGIVR